MADYRTEKDVRPTLLPHDGAAVHYLWPLSGSDPGSEKHREVLSAAARSITHVGWGVDMVAGHASVISEADANKLPGQRWRPTDDPYAPGYRVPVEGTTDALVDKHNAFLGRVGPDGFRPVPPLSTFNLVGYRRAIDPAPRPFAAFALFKPGTGDFRPFDTARNGIAVAAMMRHAAGAGGMARALGWPPEKVAGFVLGHGESRGEPHAPVQGPRLAFVPLPSIEPRGDGRARVVGSIRRALAVALGGEADESLGSLARLLSGAELIGEGQSEPVALLFRIPNSDGKIRRYIDPAAAWATVTPVILPGFDDPRKLRKRLFSGPETGYTCPAGPGQRGLLARLDRRIDFLLRKAIRQAGYAEELARDAEIEWRGVGFWPGTEPAARYTIPNQLRRFRRLHVRIVWRDAVGRPLPIPGPLCLGGGRFNGLGLFASC